MKEQQVPEGLSTALRKLDETQARIRSQVEENELGTQIPEVRWTPPSEVELKTWKQEMRSPYLDSPRYR